jgi:hypothetical protein
MPLGPFTAPENKCMRASACVHTCCIRTRLHAKTRRELRCVSAVTIVKTHKMWPDHDCGVAVVDEADVDLSEQKKDVGVSCSPMPAICTKFLRCLMQYMVATARRNATSKTCLHLPLLTRS